MNDLVGGTTTGKTLYGDGLKVGGPVYNVTQDDQQGKLDLLESTDVRVRARQEAFYKQEGGALVLAGVKGTGDYSIYGSGRIAFRWNQRATSAVTYTLHDIDMNVHLLAAGPLSNWVPYSETDGNFVPPNPGTDNFFVVQNGGAGARTDFLNIISKDWVIANGYLGTADSTDWFVDPSTERGNPYWEESTGATINAGAGPYSQQPGETWNFLTYFKPTNFADNTDTNVTYRSGDYRGPDSLSVTVGQPWIDASQNTGGGDDFNESEGAYVLTLDPTLGLTFQIDGAPTGAALQPVLQDPAVAIADRGAPGQSQRQPARQGQRLQGGGQAALASALGLDAPLALHQESASACTPPPWTWAPAGRVGTSGTAIVAARYGNGVLFNANTDKVTAASTDFNPSVGAVEFWYQPRYASNDAALHVLWYWQSGSGPYNCFGFGEVGGQHARPGGHRRRHQPGVHHRRDHLLRHGVATSSWRAYDWVHLKTSWNCRGHAACASCESS